VTLNEDQILCRPRERCPLSAEHPREANQRP
jgi:hypothetical protein